MTVWIDEMSERIAARITELNKEEQRLLQARSALVRNAAAQTAAATGAVKTAPATTRRRVRTRRTASGRAARGQRREQLLRIVTENPGVTVTEAARLIGLQPTSLYRVTNGLVVDGLVVREDKRLKPAA